MHLIYLISVGTVLCALFVNVLHFSLHTIVIEAISEVNTSVDCEDSVSLLQALLCQHAGLIDVQESNALHYLTVLRTIKAAKIEV